MESDIPDALCLSTAAGWNQTADDWAMLVSLSPRCCRAVFLERRVVATATLICYGTRLGWVGMVLTRREYQGRGFARRLVTELVACADANGIESLKLDATEQGQPLYTKLGFRVEQPVERWETTAPILAPRAPAGPGGELCEWTDAEAFGVVRGELLQRLGMRSAPEIDSDGFVYSRPGRQASMLGPCVASSRGAAERLITQRIRSAGEDHWYWDLLPKNHQAVELARSLGFSPSRRLARMVRGKECRGNAQLVYATAGFELG